MGIKGFFYKLTRGFRKYICGLSLPCERTIKSPKTALEWQGALAQSHEGDKLQIVHTPLEQHPHNAYVYSIELNRILGYLPKDFACDLLYVFGDGYCLDAELLEVYSGKEQPFFARVKIYATAKFMKPYLHQLHTLHTTEYKK